MNRILYRSSADKENETKFLKEIVKSDPPLLLAIAENSKYTEPIET